MKPLKCCVPNKNSICAIQNFINSLTIERELIYWSWFVKQYLWRFFCSTTKNVHVLHKFVYWHNEESSKTLRICTNKPAESIIFVYLLFTSIVISLHTPRKSNKLYKICQYAYRIRPHIQRKIFSYFNSLEKSNCKITGKLLPGNTCWIIFRL